MKELEPLKSIKYSPNSEMEIYRLVQHESSRDKPIELWAVPGGEIVTTDELIQHGTILGVLQ